MGYQGSTSSVRGTVTRAMAGSPAKCPDDRHCTPHAVLLGGRHALCEAACQECQGCAPAAAEPRCVPRHCQQQTSQCTRLSPLGPSAMSPLPHKGVDKLSPFCMPSGKPVQAAQASTPQLPPSAFAFANAPAVLDSGIKFPSSDSANANRSSPFWSPFSDAAAGAVAAAAAEAKALPGGGDAERDCSTLSSGQTSSGGSAPDGTWHADYFLRQDRSRTSSASLDSDTAAPKPVVRVGGTAAPCKTAGDVAQEARLSLDGYNPYFAPAFEEKTRAAVVHALRIDYAKSKVMLAPLMKALARTLHMPVLAATVLAVERVRMLAAHNMRISGPAPRETDLAVWAMVRPQPELLIIHDLREDGRTSKHPLVVGPPNLCSMAACPIALSNGVSIGAVAVFDTKPIKGCTGECAALLCNATELIARYLEQPGVADYALVDTSEPGWPVIFAGAAWTRAVGAANGDKMWDHMKLARASRMKPEDMYAVLAEDGQEFAVKGARRDTEEAVAFDLKPLHMELPFPGQRRVKVTMPRMNGPDAGKCKGADPHTMEPPPMPLYLAFLQAPHRPPSRTNSALLSTSVGEGAGTANPLQSSNGSDGSLVMPAIDQRPDDTASPFPDVQILHLLGTGSYARVYMGRWQGQVVAVKIARHDVRSASQAMSSRISTAMEGVVGAHLNHANIVHTYKYAITDSGTQAALGVNAPGGATWIVLEHLDRGSLDEAVSGGCLFRSAQTLHEGGPHMLNIVATLRQVAAGMAHLHAAGVVHGDLSSNNVLLASAPPDSRYPFLAKVCDFGLSQVLGENSHASTMTFGTPHFLPLENLRDGRLGPETDVYSFGVLMWMLYSGSPPYAGMAPMAVISHKLMGTSRLSLPLDVPAGYRELFEACQALDFHCRPTFAEIEGRLEEMLQALERGSLSHVPSFAAFGPERLQFYASVTFTGVDSDSDGSDIDYDDDDGEGDAEAEDAAEQDARLLAPGASNRSSRSSSRSQTSRSERSSATSFVAGEIVSLPSPAPSILQAHMSRKAVTMHLAAPRSWTTGPFAQYVHLPDPAGEAARCAALAAARIDVAGRQPALEPLARVLARELGVDSALFGLDGNKEQFLCATHGAEVHGALPQAALLAYWGLMPEPGQSRGVVTVEDLSEDERTREHPVVTAPPSMRALALAPLTTSSGLHLGVISCGGSRPQRFTLSQRSLLCNIAQLLVTHIEQQQLNPLCTPGRRGFALIDTRPYNGMGTSRRRSMDGWGRGTRDEDAGGRGVSSRYSIDVPSSTAGGVGGLGRAAGPGGSGKWAVVYASPEFEAETGYGAGASVPFSGDPRIVASYQACSCSVDELQVGLQSMQLGCISENQAQPGGTLAPTSFPSRSPHHPRHQCLQQQGPPGPSSSSSSPAAVQLLLPAAGARTGNSVRLQMWCASDARAFQPAAPLQLVGHGDRSHVPHEQGAPSSLFLVYVLGNKAGPASAGPGPRSSPFEQGSRPRASAAAALALQSSFSYGF